MHYTTHVQILQEKQTLGMMIAANALQIEAQIRGEPTPKIATAMARNLREIVMGLPSFQGPRPDEPGVLNNSSLAQRAAKIPEPGAACETTFPGAKPNHAKTRVRGDAMSQRTSGVEIPATRAGQLSTSIPHV